jgi:hypothetical protein
VVNHNTTLTLLPGMFVAVFGDVEVQLGLRFFRVLLGTSVEV